MKKLFLLSALALGALSMNAADITITVGGEPIENGQHVKSSKVEDILLQFGTLKLDPVVCYEIEGDANLDVTVKNTSTENYTIQFCWPSQCIDIAAGETKTQSSNTANALSNNLAIDATIFPFEEGKDYCVSCDVTIVINGDTANPFTFSLDMVYPENAAVDGVIDDMEAPVYYNLNGYQVANPEKGIFIKKQGNKISKVVL